MRIATIAIFTYFGMVAAGVAQQEGGSEPEAALDPGVVEKVDELGGKITQVARNDPGIEVSFYLGRNQDGLRLHKGLEAINSLASAKQENCPGAGHAPFRKARADND